MSKEPTTKKPRRNIEKLLNRAGLLRLVRDDVKAMDWEKVSDDGHSVLVAKADVLEIIDDFIGYVAEIKGQ